MVNSSERTGGVLREGGSTIGLVLRELSRDYPTFKDLPVCIPFPGKADRVSSCTIPASKRQLIRFRLTV
jgi:hypothetical protein